MFRVHALPLNVHCTRKMQQLLMDVGCTAHNGPMCFELVDHSGACDLAFVSKKEKRKRKPLFIASFSSVGGPTDEINSVHASHCDKSRKIDAQ